MRNMICKLDPKESLEYQKPQSLEEAPARDVNSFIRENNLSSGRNPLDSNVLSNDNEDDLDLDMEDEEA